MTCPPFVLYTSPEEYRAHFERLYCQGPVSTFDGIQVRFRRLDFDHCMYESTYRNPKDPNYRQKNVFSIERAKRIDWIKAALQDCNAELYVGWDRDDKRARWDRRVVFAYDGYVVIVELKRGNTQEAKFLSAYPTTDRTMALVKGQPRWPR